MGDIGRLCFSWPKAELLVARWLSGSVGLSLHVCLQFGGMTKPCQLILAKNLTLALSNCPGQAQAQAQKYFSGKFSHEIQQMPVNCLTK